MLQILSISEARNNFAKLIKKVKETKRPVVIVQDSSPSVVLYPYDEVIKDIEKKDALFEAEFQTIVAEGKKAFAKYLAEKKIKKPLTEKEAYDLIKNGVSEKLFSASPQR